MKEMNKVVESEKPDDNRDVRASRGQESQKKCRQKFDSPRLTSPLYKREAAILQKILRTFP